MAKKKKTEEQEEEGKYREEEEWWGVRRGEEMKGGVGGGGGGGGGGGSSYALHPKRRWKGFVVAVLGLVFLSMLVPLIFLLGLHNGFHSSGISLTSLFPYLAFFFFNSDLFICCSQFPRYRSFTGYFRWILCQIWIFYCHSGF